MSDFEKEKKAYFDFINSLGHEVEDEPEEFQDDV